MLYPTFALFLFDAAAKAVQTHCYYCNLFDFLSLL